ncbi:MAG: chemotaxis response regulator protein-glutamate methylesterase [Rhodospirillaceae bacterium]
MTFSVSLPNTTGRLPPLRIMVVDDSVVMRGLISRMCGEDPAAMEVVATAANGQLAVERAAKRDIDVVVLDIEMPVLDGISALPKLLAIDPRIVVIMASSLTSRNAEISLKALEKGAKDYVPKPSSVVTVNGGEEFKRELLEKIRALGARYRRAPVEAPARIAPAVRAPALRAAHFAKPYALAFGSSTGGPTALTQVLKAIPAPLRVPVFITQHMPATFTALLAQNITRETGHSCVEARHGDIVTPGRIHLAPGDHHMTIARSGAHGVINLNQGAKENFCRPAVDPMLRSLADFYQRNLLVVILTGMGQDGLAGSEVVVKAGGSVLAQDEESSVVWGMPGAVARAGLCNAVLPLSQMAGEIQRMLTA